MSLIGDFGQGAVLGFSIAAPVGPIGLLCIRRTLEHGPTAGIAGGLGTAAADASYAAVAAFGLTAVSAVVTAVALPLQVLGILTLAWLGARTMMQPPATTAASARGAHAALFAQTFFLTLTNPATIISFAAIFAGLGLATGGGAVRAGALVGGTFAGSLAWWIVLSGAIGAARTKITPAILIWINRGAGAVLIGFAAVLAARLL
jgi:putative LysE/RhtB family amino acid efflux pump